MSNDNGITMASERTPLILTTDGVSINGNGSLNRGAFRSKLVAASPVVEEPIAEKAIDRYLPYLHGKPFSYKFWE